jgi:hypothetical protein
LTANWPQPGAILAIAVLLGQKFGSPSVVRAAIIAVAAIAVQRGDSQCAVRLAAAAVSGLPDSGRFELEALLNERYLDPLVSEVDAGRHEAAAAEGRRWSLERAVGEAVHTARSSAESDGVAAADAQPRADPLAWP